MDYLKFCIVSLLCFILILGISSFLGAGLSFFILAGGTLGYMIRWRPMAHTIAYGLWLISIACWTFFSEHILAELAAEEPEKYSLANHNLHLGILLVLGAILFNPLCYGVGRIIAHSAKRHTHIG